MGEDEGEVPSVSQHITAGGDVFAAGRDINFHGDPPYESYIRNIRATALDVGYDVFWAGSTEYRICALNGDIEAVKAAKFIARRSSDEHGVHLPECTELLSSLNRDTASAILRLDDKLAGKILVAMGDGLGKFLSEVSTRSVPDAGYFLYLAATHGEFRYSVRALFAADLATEWRNAWINELEPDHAAFLLCVVGAPWPGRLLPVASPLRAAQITLSSNGSGRWLYLTGEQGRSAVLAEAARENPTSLADRILENPYPKAKKLISVLSRGNWIGVSLSLGLASGGSACVYLRGR